MKKEPPVEIEIAKWVLRFSDNTSRVSLIAIGKDGKEYSPRYYAEFGREYEYLDIKEL